MKRSSNVVAKSKKKMIQKKSAPKKSVVKKVVSKKTAPKIKAAAKAVKSATKKVNKKTVTKSASAKPSSKAAPKKAAKVAPRSKIEASAQKTKSKVPTSQFHPLNDRVLVARAGESDRTAGGIFIPQTALERPLKGRVLAVGPGAKDKKGRTRPLDVKPGDEVLYGKFAGTEVTVDGQELLILKEEDILGVVAP